METPILFHSKSLEYGWLSNFSKHPFTIDGNRWPSVEHFYQAQKFVGTAAEHCIRLAESPLKARKAGQDRSLVPRADWDSAKAEVMHLAVRAKFEQNRQLRKRLLDTGNLELVHFSTNDLFWGRTADGDGDNRLGVIIMELRDFLRC